MHDWQSALHCPAAGVLLAEIILSASRTRVFRHPSLYCRAKRITNRNT